MSARTCPLLLFLYYLMVRVFANGPEDLGSIPGRVIPKAQKMVFVASLLDTQPYKVWIKGKVEQSRERRSALPSKRELLGQTWLRSPTLLTLLTHHHHHVVPLARISLTLSRHFSLSFIASGRSPGLHLISSQSCFMYVLAGSPALARRPALMSSSLLLQQCPACLVRLTWIVFVMGGRWPYSWCFVGYCRQDLFNIARNILV